MSGLRFMISLNTTRGEGDVLNVRLEGSPIGAREAKEFLVLDVPQADFGSAKYADWDCAGIFAKLDTLRKAGEPFPVITHPYAVYEKPNELATQERRMVKRSLVGVNIDLLPDKVDIRDKTKTVAPKTTVAITIKKIAKPKDTLTEAELEEHVKQETLKKVLGQ